MKSYIKELVGRYFKSFSFFYSYLGYRILLVLSLSLLVGVLDGLGLAMFIPLLEMVDNSGAAKGAESLGNLRFILDFLGSLGIPLSLVSILGLMLFFFIFKGVAKFFEGYFRVVYQQFFMKTIRVNNAEALAHFNYLSFMQTDSGRIQNTFGAEVNRVNYSFVTYFATAQAIVLVTVYMVLALFNNVQFALLISLGGGLTNLLFKRLFNATKKASKQYTTEAHKFQGLLLQKVANFKYLKATSRIYFYTKKVKNQILKLEKVQRRIGLLDATMMAVREPMIMIVVVAVILIQTQLFGEPLTTIILSLLFFYRALTYLMNLQKQWNAFLGTTGSLENMESFVKELRAGKEHSGTVVLSEFNNVIDVHDLSFSYGDKPVLEGVNLQIPKHSTVAFVGESGSGKTTLVNIIAGLIVNEEGKLLIDGIDYKSLDRTSLANKVGYITQEPVIFNDTIFNNVTFWEDKTPETLERFNEAIIKSAIFDFVDDQDLKEEALLGNNGINLSGGQRQRISIARELYKKAEILIMDEATSALDTDTELMIQTNIEALRGNYTIIMIAHRLSTVKKADMVHVMSRGQIIASGDFNTLLSESTAFKNMVKLQEF